MHTLGINAVYHDSAACVVRDGEILAAAEEERFTRVKHGKRPVPFTTYELPFHAIRYCLKEAGVTLAEIDHVGYSYNPYLLLNHHGKESAISLPLEPSAAVSQKSDWESAWDPLFLSYIVNAPRQLLDGAPHHLQSNFGGMKGRVHYSWHFVEHHLAHAASAFLVSPFDRAAVLTLDGRGEKSGTGYYVGEGAKLRQLGQVALPHSLGLLYERVTEYLGFLRSSDEYKVMAMASFGRPAYYDFFRDLVQVSDNGQYRVGSIDWGKDLGAARKSGGPIEPRHNDIAHSLQKVLQETVLNLAEWLRQTSGAKNICMAGGVALNCVMNAHLRDHGPFERVWVQPAAGDAGTALGAALWIDAVQRRAEQNGRRSNAAMTHAYLGPQYSELEIEQFLTSCRARYERIENLAARVADLLTQDKVIGWFQGRMEFGPRALGGRSILASPLHASMQARLNEIKEREDFRPVAPVVLEEMAADWFLNATNSPFMLFVYDVAPEKANRIPAVRHTDGTARVQTIRREQNPVYYDVIRSFYERTGVPILVNTSFNTRGKPMVCSPRDALECFWSSPLDALVLGPFLLEK